MDPDRKAQEGRRERLRTALIVAAFAQTALALGGSWHPFHYWLINLDTTGYHVEIEERVTMAAKYDSTHTWTYPHRFSLDVPDKDSESADHLKGWKGFDTLQWVQGYDSDGNPIRDAEVQSMKIEDMDWQPCRLGPKGHLVIHDRTPTGE